MKGIKKERDILQAEIGENTPQGIRMGKDTIKKKFGGVDFKDKKMQVAGWPRGNRGVFMVKKEKGCHRGVRENVRVELFTWKTFL